MNCQDMTRIIDSGRIDTLSSQELEEAESHASSCGRCAPQWLAHRHLGAVTIPHLPPDLLARCLVAANEGVRGSRSGRVRRVTIVLGCVAVAAAAATLVARFSAPPSPQGEHVVGVPTPQEQVAQPLVDGALVTSRSAAPTTAQEPATGIGSDIPIFPPQYAADLAMAERRKMALEKFVELHPEVTEPLPAGMLYDATILLRSDAEVLSHSFRTIAREELHWSRYDFSWGGLPADGGEGFGDYVTKGTQLADGRTLGADLSLRQLVVRKEYDPARSDRRVEEIIRTERAAFMLPATGTGARHVTVLLSPTGDIEREVPGFISGDAVREQEDWSAMKRAEVMAGVLGISKEEIGLMGSVPVGDEQTRRMVFVDYAWRRLPDESAPQYRQAGWDRYNPQGVDVATALAVVERVMPEAFLGEELERALGIPAVILTEDGSFIRTARVRSSDPREDLPGISIATFRLLVLKNSEGATSAVYFMWQGTPSDSHDPSAPPGSPR